MPGRIPPTSQLDWLISTTAMMVLFWSRATRDLLKSFGWGIAALHRLVAATKLPSSRRPSHSISPLEGTGFELPVRGRGQPGCRPFYAGTGRCALSVFGQHDALHQSGVDPTAEAAIRRRTAPNFAWSGKK